MADNFFKNMNVWQKVQRYFSRSNIQTTDSQTSDLHVKTTPHNWFHTVMPSSWTWYNSEIYPQERLRKKRIQDYNMMDEDGDITNALNIYADSATQVDLETGHTILVEGNPKVQKCVEDFLYETILFDEQAWGLARDLCKYGDAGFEIVLDNNKEDITKLVNIPIEGFRRIEINRSLKGFQFDPKLLMLQGMQKTDIVNYEPFEVAHFTLRTNESRYYPLGRSILEGSRKSWKQLKILEDSLVINRLVRAPERRVFMIEVGNLTSAEAKQFLEEVKMEYNKKKFYNPSTGEIDEKASPLAQMEDFFIPVRQGAGSKIDTLPGACLVLDTKIPLLDGRSLELQELIKEYNEGKENWVYSCCPNTGKIVPGPIVWAGRTKDNTEILELELDNGKTVKCTPDHKFPVIGKGFVEAKDLKIGESMIPLYRRRVDLKENYKSHYEQFFDVADKEWKFSHREFCLEEKSEVIHHKDFNKLNNSPNNLQTMTWKDHQRLHASVGFLMLNKEQRQKLGRDSSEAVAIRRIVDSKFKEELKNKKSYSKKLWWENLSEEDKTVMIDKAKNSYSKEDRIRVASIAGKKRAKSLSYHTIFDQDFKQELLKRRGKSISFAQSNRTKDQKAFSAQKYRNTFNNDFSFISERQTIKFNKKLLDLVHEYTIRLDKKSKVLDFIYNDESQEFLNEFCHINKDTVRFGKVFYEETFNKLLRYFNYKDFYDFKRKALCYNHKIISIRRIDNADTGTLTIGNEYHTFALEAGIFTKNSNMDQIADVDMFRSKMISALGIPPQYMSIPQAGGGGGGNYDTKAGLSQQDIRFGRTILRIQKSIVSALYKICYIQLYLKGFGVNDIKSLEISMTPPNAIEESMRLDAINKRIESAASAKNSNLFSDKWILGSIMLFSDDDIQEDLEQRQLEIGLGLTEEGVGGGGVPGAGGEEPGAFDAFAGGEGEEGGEAALPKGPINVEATPEEPAAPEQQTAGLKRDKSKIINEHNNNKYFYKGGIFNHLLNECQFDGLIDIGGSDETKKSLIKEDSKAKTVDIALQEIVDEIDSNS